MDSQSDENGGSKEAGSQAENVKRGPVTEKVEQRPLLPVRREPKPKEEPLEEEADSKEKKPKKKKKNKAKPEPEPKRALYKGGAKFFQAKERPEDLVTGTAVPVKEEEAPDLEEEVPKRGKLEAYTYRQIFDQILHQLVQQSRRPVPAGPVLLLLVVFTILTAFFFHHGGYQSGVADGYDAAEKADTKEGSALSTEADDMLDQAMEAMRKSDPASALASLQQLERQLPNLPSVTYLEALAAMEDNQISLAEDKVQQSINRRERVSDSLALQAVLELQRAHQPGFIRFGDPRLRAEQLLRQAIVVDPSNPYPRFELATLLRYTSRRDEAVKALASARSRLNPIDSHMIMDVTSAIMGIENGDPGPGAEAANSDDIGKVFPAAFAAMKAGNHPLAKTLLGKAHAVAAPEIYSYLMNDPGVRKYSKDPEYKEFLPR